MRITKATAKRLTKKHLVGVNARVQIESDLVEIRCDSDEDMDKAEQACHKMCEEAGRGYFTLCGGDRIIYYYKAESAPDMGDFDDTTSAWHY